MVKYVGLQIDGAETVVVDDEEELPTHGVVAQRVTETMLEAVEEGMPPLSVVVGAVDALSGLIGETCPRELQEQLTRDLGDRLVAGTRRVRKAHDA